MNIILTLSEKTKKKETKLLSILLVIPKWSLSLNHFKFIYFFFLLTPKRWWKHQFWRIYIFHIRQIRGQYIICDSLRHSFQIIAKLPRYIEIAFSILYGKKSFYKELFTFHSWFPGIFLYLWEWAYFLS